MVRVAIDVMGGDFGPTPILEGILQAYKFKKFEPILVGEKEQIEKLAPKKLLAVSKIVASSDVIGMHESATDAMKRKESSIFKAVNLVRQDEADAVVSAGHSGASMSLATVRIGRLEGVSRPAIATLMPTHTAKKTLVLDVGANVDSKSDHLYQFGVMGEAYVKNMFGLQKPRVGLLANGEEKSKGNEAVKQAHEKMKDLEYFVGNVEGNNIFDGSVDVVVCDGFVGNVLLKTSEGVADAIYKFMKTEIKKSPIAIAGALLMKKVFKNLKKHIDYAEYGGAPLLGVKGCTIISHGKSNAKAIKNAVFQAVDYVESGANAHIEQSLK
ncbi:MAG: phosphate acyltransferase PlsX [Campylobacterota bacterium]